MIYLDHNATTNIYSEVQELITSLMKKSLNPSSIHAFGREGKYLIEEARKQVASLVNIDNDLFRDYQVTFTSSGTEANNLVISNFATLNHEIFTSKIEHHSILGVCKNLSNVCLIKVQQNGLVDLEDLEKKLSTSKSNSKLVSVMRANNETGIIQPIEEIVAIAHKHGALTHSDMVQAPGKISIDLPDVGLDFATISSHKFGGPIGSGALIFRINNPLQPMIIGGGQERGLRGGTENVPAIVGMGLACSIVKTDLRKNIAHMQNLQIKLENIISRDFLDVEIVGKNVARLPNTTLLINAKKKGETQVIAFDLNGIAISSGSACSSGKVGKSESLRAMHYPDNKAGSAIRISTNISNSAADIDNFIEVLKKINS